MQNPNYTTRSNPGYKTPLVDVGNSVVQLPQIYLAAASAETLTGLKLFANSGLQILNAGEDFGGLALTSTPVSIDALLGETAWAATYQPAGAMGFYAPAQDFDLLVYYGQKTGNPSKTIPAGNEIFEGRIPWGNSVGNDLLQNGVSLNPGGSGLTPYQSLNLVSAGEQASTGAGALYGWCMTNTDATHIAYIEFYDAVAPIISGGGEATPFMVIGVNPNSATPAFISPYPIELQHGLYIRGANASGLGAGSDPDSNFIATVFTGS